MRSGSVRLLTFVSAGLWLMLWAGLNTAPEWLNRLEGIGLVHGLRALCPLLAGALAFVLWPVGRQAWAPMSAMGWLELYGWIGLAASFILSPNPWFACYWGLAYIAVIQVVRLWWLYPDPPRALLTLLGGTWLIIAGIGAALAWIAWRHQSPSSGHVHSFYWILTTMPSLMETAMVRATGISRYAAVIGLVALAHSCWAQRRSAQLAWAAVTGIAGSVVWLCQSMGSTLAFAVAAALILGIRHRWLLVAGAVAGAAVLLAHPGTWSYFTRGKSFALMLSGRPSIWMGAVEILRDSPGIGLGFYADRLLLEAPYRNHISNGLLHAAAQAGLIGGAAFLAAWVAGWRRLLHILRSGMPDRSTIIVAGVLLFMTLRSIIESTGAFFGVDWLLLAPLLAYLDSTSRRRLRVAEPMPAP